MKALFYKDGNSLKTASQEGERYLARMGQGEECLIEVTRPRNLQYHKWFMNFCGFIAEHSGGKYSAYTVAKLLELATGHCDAVKTRSGIQKIPRSINFSSMPQEEFETFVRDAKAYAAQEIAPWINDPEVADEFEKFLI